MLRMPAPMSLNALTPEHALGGDDAEVLGHGAALDPGGGGDEHRRPPATIQLFGRPWPRLNGVRVTVNHQRSIEQQCMS
jgi:hypothetical protein